MDKYKLTDIKVGAVFKESGTTRTIIAVCNLLVIYSYTENGLYKESAANINHFSDGDYGELVVPITKVACVVYQSKYDLRFTHCCSKEVWYRGMNDSTNHKFIREFEMELGADGFPIEGAYE